MIAEKMKPFVQNNSAIRMMFEEGNRLRAKYGADKVYDFSLGNPSVPAPDCVREAIIDLVNNEEPTVLHGYMSNAGFEDVRETIAQSLNRRFGTAFSAHNLIMTVGAASGLNVILKTILNPGEEVIVFAPYFLEYGAYVRNYDGKLVEISLNYNTELLYSTISFSRFLLHVFYISSECRRNRVLLFRLFFLSKNKWQSSVCVQSCHPNQISGHPPSR